jgi:hypothetical protein
MARDEFLLGSLDMAIATVRRQFYDSEARPLARRHHIRVARPSRAVNLSAKDKFYALVKSRSTIVSKQLAQFPFRRF